MHFSLDDPGPRERWTSSRRKQNPRVQRKLAAIPAAIARHQRVNWADIFLSIFTVLVNALVTKFHKFWVISQTLFFLWVLLFLLWGSHDYELFQGANGTSQERSLTVWGLSFSLSSLDNGLHDTPKATFLEIFLNKLFLYIFHLNSSFKTHQALNYHL